MEVDQKTKIFTKAYVAGSGSNYLLLTGSHQDQLQFRLIDIEQYKLIDISMGGMFCLAINVSNSLLVWGILGTKALKLPQIILSTRQIKQVNCGWDHALIVDSQNCLYGLGRNKQKQLADSKQAYYENVIELQNKQNMNIKHICCGFRQSYVSDGIVLLGKGDNKNNELGSSNQVGSWKTVGIFQKGINKIVCGKKFLLVLSNQNKVFASGKNQYNMFQIQSQSLFSFQMIFQDVDDIGAGWSHLVISRNNSIESYGRNNFGQLGRDPLVQQNTKIKISNQSKFQRIQNLTCGTQFTFVSVNEKVYGWGWNEHSNITNNKQQIIKQPLEIPCEYIPSKIITNGACTLLMK